MKILIFSADVTIDADRMKLQKDVQHALDSLTSGQTVKVEWLQHSSGTDNYFHTVLTAIVTIN